MRSINSSGLDLIKSHEGFAAEPYKCPAGYMTVGYGHVIRASDAFKYPLSVEQVEDILRADVAFAEAAVVANAPSGLTDNQFAALVSFTFNVGAAAFARSTLRKKLIGYSDGRVDYSGYDWDRAAREELPRWNKGGGRVLRGLVRRRQEELDLFLT